MCATRSRKSVCHAMRHDLVFCHQYLTETCREGNLFCEEKLRLPALKWSGAKVGWYG